MLTFLPLEEIDKMDAWEGAQLNTAKEILAYELTKLVHGEEEAKKAQESARALFSQGNADNMPTTELEEGDFQDGKIDILAVLVKGGQASSRSETALNFSRIFLKVPVNWIPALRMNLLSLQNLQKKL